MGSIAPIDPAGHRDAALRTAERKPVDDKLFFSQIKPRRQVAVIDRKRLFSGPLGTRHAGLRIGQLNRPRIALSMWWCHEARNREMSRARREPPTVDRNAPRRRIPMKSAGGLGDHHGVIVGGGATQ